MEILQKIDMAIPFEWFDYDCWPDSSAVRIILELIDHDTFYEISKERIIQTALLLISNSDENTIVIGQAKPDFQWGEMTIDAFNLDGSELVFNAANVSKCSKRYLDILTQSKIDFSYEGFCVCKDWNTFLETVVECVLAGTTPFSPLIYDLKNERVIYFHHTYSIGVYCKTASDAEFLSRNSDRFGLSTPLT